MSDYGMHGNFDSGIDMGFKLPEEELEIPEYEGGIEIEPSLLVTEADTDYVRGLKEGVEVAIRAMSKWFSNEIESVRAQVAISEYQQKYQEVENAYGNK
jgi:hypothetical protein